jgi:hypothetical protein
MGEKSTPSITFPRKEEGMWYNGLSAQLRISMEYFPKFSWQP